MKTNRMFMAAVASMALTLFGGTVQAQYKAVGDDGIAASPRLRESLNEYARNHKSAVTHPMVASMACPMCKDKVSQRIDYTARGANKPIVRVATHQCQSCSTRWTVAGVGKAKHPVATHTCTANPDANCAVSTR